MSQTAQPNNVQEITLPGGKRARLLIMPPRANPGEVVARLGLGELKALVLVVGTTAQLEPSVEQRLFQLFSRGLARAVRQTEAGVIDGGTASGIIAVLGQALAEQSPHTLLIGVAPLGKVNIPGQEETKKHHLEAHHTHFVLVKANKSEDKDNWGDETEDLLLLAAQLGQNKPVITLVAGGGDVTRNEVVRSVRQGWPIIVVNGSGRLADELAAHYHAYEAARQQGQPLPVSDKPELAEIVSEGDLHFVSINEDSTEGLERLILLLCRPDSILKEAWQQQAEYSENARRYQKYFLRLQNGILALSFGVAVITVSKIAFPDLQARFFGWPEPLLYYALLLIPIVQVALITVVTQFNLSNKWLSLRGATETIKQHIYRYRTRSGLYSNRELYEDSTSREARLVENLQLISNQWLEGEINLITLRSINQPKRSLWQVLLRRKATPPDDQPARAEDDGVSFLSPEKYIKVRLKDQAQWYRRKASGLERRLNLLQWICIISSALGTFLVAIKLEIWIAVTTSLLTVLTAYLEYRQVANTLRQYNQAATTLGHIERWWKVLLPREQTRQKNIDRLVDLTESTLATENQNWLQQMKFAVSQLQDIQKKARTAPQEVVVTQNTLKAEVEISQTPIQPQNKGTAGE